MHIVIFPTWDCQLSCVYCSIRHSSIDRTVPGVGWQTWAKAVPRAVPRGSLVDVAGGEPLIYPGIVELLHSLGRAGLRWAITTNGKAVGVVEQLCREKPLGAVAVNISDHSSNPEAPEAVAMLRRAGYHVNTHRVDHPAAGQRLEGATVITYQDWIGGRACDGVKRHCTAGLNHWVAGPNGDMWRCVVALETGQPSGGNLFEGRVEAGKMDCDFGCTSCYTEEPGSWLIQMREEI